MILAIVGSTAITPDQWQTAKMLIRGIIYAYGKPPVVSGGAEGIDQIAEAVALNEGCLQRVFRPQFQRWEPDGFKDRNMLIAQECTVLWSIRSKQSKTYGSGWTADYAESLGKEVHRIMLV